MQIQLHTPKGDIRIRLYDETPLHRDNFVKLVKEGYYDGTLFHRIIKDFMIQGGDPDSKGAPQGKRLGMGGPGYTIPAEILPQFCHKRGALAAARQGDEVNPHRESSGSQFYIVWGQVYSPAQLQQLSQQMAMQDAQTRFNQLMKAHYATIFRMRKDRNREGLQTLQEELIQQAQATAKGLSPEQITCYSTIGGTPHLDGQYTVFGEVEEGLDVLETLQKVATDAADRPLEDLPIHLTLLP